MQIESVESLFSALRGSGLFTADMSAAIVAELAPLGDDPPALMRELVSRKRITLYQLRKVVNGKAAELFIGPYVVLDKLGEGGMGKVYKVRHTLQNRTVALKVVRSNLLANPVVRGRYDREVQAALALSHPNIVSVFSAGSTDGQYYLEMEFVNGLDLARLVQKYGLLEVPEACEYLRQAALGLHHAHERGFVHRDIKPSNIVVSGERHIASATGPAIVRILDMGLIRSVAVDEEDALRGLTRDGTVVGTPDYMAPEQAKNSRSVDRRADLYSLGGAFYFLLTGKPPFPGGSPLDKIICHVEQAPPSLGESRSDVPEDLIRIVAKLMAKAPSQRYATAAEVAEALAPLARVTHDAARDPSAETEPLASLPVPSSVATPAPPPIAPKARAVGPSERTPRPASPGKKTDANSNPFANVSGMDRVVLVVGIAATAIMALGIAALVLAVAFGR